MNRSTSGRKTFTPLSKISFDYVEPLNETSATSIMNYEVDDWQVRMYRSKLIKKKETIEIYKEELEIKSKEYLEKIDKKKKANKETLESLIFLIKKEKENNHKLTQQIGELEEKSKARVYLSIGSVASFSRDLESVSFSFSH